MRLLTLFLLALPLWAQPTGVSVDEISHSSARIRYTAVAGAKYVSYGLTTSVDYNTSTTSRREMMYIGGLAPNTRYYFNVTDPTGTWVCAGAGSYDGYDCDGAEPGYFTTLSLPDPHPVEPILPTELDTTMPTITGSTFTVGAGCTDLQAQLDAAADADTALNHEVIIPVGAVCEGRFTLKDRTGNGTIVVRPDSMAGLPAEGVRATSAHVAGMYTLKAPANDYLNVFGSANSGSVIFDNGGTEGWRFVGAEITHASHAEYTPTALTITGVSVFDANEMQLDLSVPHGIETHTQFTIGGSPEADLNGVQRATQIVDSDSIRVSGTTGTTAGGTLFLGISNTITGCTNASPIVCATGVNHGLDAGSGDPVEVWGVEGNTAANGTWEFTVVDANEISLTGSVGNGAYTSGGYVTADPDFYSSLVALNPGSSRIGLDRCYIHSEGFPSRVQFAVKLNSEESFVIDSHIENINSWRHIDPTSGARDTARAGVNAANAIAIEITDGAVKKIHNNLIEDVPGITIFAQEGDPTNSKTTDLTITRNEVVKSEGFMAGSAASNGRYYVVRHGLELKQGKRVLIDGNIFDGNWADEVPTGPMISVNARAGSKDNDQEIADFTFTNNTIRNSSSGIYVVSYDIADQATSKMFRRAKIENNLFHDNSFWYFRSQPSGVNGVNKSTNFGGQAVQIAGATEDVQIENNTFVDFRGKGPFFWMAGGRSEGFSFSNNIFPYHRDATGFRDSWPVGADWGGGMVPAISGTSVHEAYQDYFTNMPDPDSESPWAGNLIIPGVEDTGADADYTSTGDSENHTLDECEDFFTGFDASNVCLNEGATPLTFNDRLALVFVDPANDDYTQLEGYEGYGADIAALEAAQDGESSDPAIEIGGAVTIRGTFTLQ